MQTQGRRYCLVSGALFSLVAIAHLLRLIEGLPVQVGRYDVPMFVSWIGLLVPAVMATWALRTARSRGGDGQ